MYLYGLFLDPDLLNGPLYNHRDVFIVRLPPLGFCGLSDNATETVMEKVPIIPGVPREKIFSRRCCECTHLTVSASDIHFQSSAAFDFLTIHVINQTK